MRQRRWCGLWTVAMLAVCGLSPGQTGTERGEGLEVWNSSVMRDENLRFDGQSGKVEPITMVGVRNGTFSGAVVVASKGPIKGLTARMSDLRAAGVGAVIPAASAAVRYALPALWWQMDKPETYPAGGFARFDGLSERAPASIPVITGAVGGRTGGPVGRAVQPIWVTVRIPVDAPEGEYSGTLDIAADGHRTSVPVTLTVYGWKLPSPREFTTFVDLVQSPETPALNYDTPLWSDAHFKVLEKSIALLAQAGDRTVYLHLIGETNQGNADTMVLWVPDGKGGYQYDFTPMNRYLDLVRKHYGTPDVVCLYVWDAWMEGGDHRSLAYWQQTGDTKHLDAWKNKAGGGPVVTVRETDGTLKTTVLPPRTTPEGLALWADFSRALLEELGKRKLQGRLMLGMLGDQVPGGEALDIFSKTMPGLPWVKQSHSMKVYNGGANDTTARAPTGFTVRYAAFVWGATFVHPAQLRHGWQKQDMQTCYPRGITTGSSVLTYRHLGEMNIGGNQCGFGRIGADFWPVLRNRRGVLQGGILGRFPHAEWKNLDIRASLLAPGADGAVATRRYEMMREGLQECEARIFIDKALTDRALREKLGETLARQCEQMLLDRNAAILKGFNITRPDAWQDFYGWMSPNASQKFDEDGYDGVWQDLSRRLFSTARAVAEKLGR